MYGFSNHIKKKKICLLFLSAAETPPNLNLFYKHRRFDLSSYQLPCLYLLSIVYFSGLLE